MDQAQHIGIRGETQPSIDVIVPCYKYGHYLEGCVESALNQDNVNVRVLVVDDTSPDDTESVGRGLAERDARVSYVRHAVNKGHIWTFNEGIEWASAQSTLLLSADDYLLPGSLERACGLMEQRSSIGLVFGEAMVSYADGSSDFARPLARRDGQESWVMSGAEFITASGASNIVPTPTAIVRTALQKQTGGYRFELPHTGDMEMWLRLAAMGDVGYIARPLGVYRLHNANMSLAYTGNYLLKDLNERFRTLTMFFETGAPPLATDTATRRMLLRSLSLQAVARAGMAFNEGDLQASEALRDFAVSVWPPVRTSAEWFRLLSKRVIGSRGWRSIRSARSAFFG